MIYLNFVLHTYFGIVRIYEFHRNLHPFGYTIEFNEILPVSEFKIVDRIVR